MDWTDCSEECLQWKGDHDAVEDWAEEILTRHQGKRPDRAVFTGDHRGVYVDPRRMAALGVPSRYSAPVLVKHGMWIEWNGLEFVVADAADLLDDRRIDEADMRSADR